VSSAKVVLFALLGLDAALFVAVWLRTLLRNTALRRPTPYELLVGFITDFLDTLGVGSFATTTFLYRARRTVPDEKIPGTLNVGHALPTVAQALIYITAIHVEMKTLALLIAASVLGAVLGARVVTAMPRRAIQIGMGLSLLAAAGFILSRLLQGAPEGGTATGLEGPMLVVGVIGNFVFGALMMIGVGAYAPIMTMIALLGMNVTTAFPIMMGSCAFLMPMAGIRFIRTGKYEPRAAVGLTLAGIPAVLVAAFIVVKLPLDVVRWLVLVVVIYTALAMLWAARRGQ
jgi:uncharacterized membrane protein YfcA